LEVYSSVFIHYDNLLTCVYTPIHADTAAGIIVEDDDKSLSAISTTSSWLLLPRAVSCNPEVLRRASFWDPLKGKKILKKVSL
jgi:hypothetical protein